MKGKITKVGKSRIVKTSIGFNQYGYYVVKDSSKPYGSTTFVENTDKSVKLFKTKIKAVSVAKRLNK